MLRKPGWTSTAFLAALGTLVAISATATATSHAAADACLTAPSGVTPKGQHWYYRLDHANNRKCWYLRAPTPTPPAQAAAPADGDTAARPTNAAAPPAPEAPAAAPSAAEPAPVAPPAAAAAAPPARSSVDQANTADRSRANGASSAPTPAEPETVTPPQAATDANATDGATNLAPATPADAAAGPDAADADLKTGSVPAEASTTTSAPTTARPDSVTQPDPAPPKALAADEPSTGSVAENLLIVGLAAALAGIVSAAFAAFRRRKAATAKPVDATPRFGSKFGSKLDSKLDSWPERRSIGRTRVPTRTAPASHATPIEASLIPEQLTMTRPSAPPRGAHRAMRDRRVHADAVSTPD